MLVWIGSLQWCEHSWLEITDDSQKTGIHAAPWVTENSRRWTVGGTGGVRATPTSVPDTGWATGPRGRGSGSGPASLWRVSLGSRLSGQRAMTWASGGAGFWGNSARLSTPPSSGGVGPRIKLMTSEWSTGPKSGPRWPLGQWFPARSGRVRRSVKSLILSIWNRNSKRLVDAHNPFVIDYFYFERICWHMIFFEY